MLIIPSGVKIHLALGHTDTSIPRESSAERLQTGRRLVTPAAPDLRHCSRLERCILPA